MADTDTGVPERVDTVNLADLEKKYPSRDGEAFLAALGGSARSGYFNQAVFAELIGAVGPNEHFDGAMLAKALAAAVAAFKPKDEIEGMLASQAVAMHFASMRCLKLAVNKPVDMASRYHRDGANLARAMTDMLTALDEKRGKRRRQVVRIEKVTVQEGAQAIIGNVNGQPAGEELHRSEQLPHEPSEAAFLAPVSAMDGSGDPKALQPRRCARASASAAMHPAPPVRHRRAPAG